MKRFFLIALQVCTVTLWVLSAAAGSSSVPTAPLFVGISDQHLDADHNIVENCFVEALVKAGHVPIVIPCITNDAALATIVSKIDLVLLTGGADVDPARYRTPRSPSCGKPDLVRDDFEFRLLAAARRRRLPILGICRGSQLLNIGFGGTLWQDLPSEFPKDGTEVCHSWGSYLNPAKYTPAHTVKILPGSRLATILGTAPLAVNSHHHQAVKRLAPGFNVSAVAPDGVIEGFEAQDYPAVGLQFHPESIVARAEDDPDYDFCRMIRIFRALRELCGPSKSGI